MENPKMNKIKFKQLTNMMFAYQEEYESEKENEWVKCFNTHLNDLDTLCNQLNDKYRELAFTSQHLGFIQGLNFALNIMEISGEGKNKDILQKVIQILENKPNEETEE